MYNWVKQPPTCVWLVNKIGNERTLKNNYYYRYLTLHQNRLLTLVYYNVSVIGEMYTVDTSFVTTNKPTSKQNRAAFTHYPVSFNHLPLILRVLLYVSCAFMKHYYAKTIIQQLSAATTFTVCALVDHCWRFSLRLWKIPHMALWRIKVQTLTIRARKNANVG